MATLTKEELQEQLELLKQQNADLIKQNNEKTAVIIELQNKPAEDEKGPDDKPNISEGAEVVAAWYFRMHPNYKHGSILVSLKDGELFPATAKGENFCKNYCGDAYAVVSKK